MVTAPLSPEIARAMAKVPAARCFTSNTPIGPFQMTVLADASSRSKSAIDLGPMSSPMRFGCIAETAEVTADEAGASIDSADTTSTGSTIGTRLAWAFSRILAAAGTKSRSTRDLPTESPCAARKVNIMPPPMRSLSHLPRRDSSTGIFVDTFAPPITATNGRLGFSTAPCRNSISLAIRNPATRRCTKGATPDVDACARCAAPNASFT
eukprot:Amastigsp_a841750_96.p2 type:complete len:209 gc:universal Amastigsp_a841750_96:189-815(+)